MYFYATIESAPKEGKFIGFIPGHNEWMTAWWDDELGDWWAQDGDTAIQVTPKFWLPFPPMPFSKDELLFLLECMKMADEEGFHLNGHYGSRMKEDDILELGKRLCRETGIPIEGRDWLKG